MEQDITALSLFDGDDFSELRGKRRKPRYKKRRYGLNKAVGYIPAVAAVRYIKDRRDAKDMEARRENRRRRKAQPSAKTRRPLSGNRSGASKKYISTENSEIARNQRRRPQPKMRSQASTSSQTETRMQGGRSTPPRRKVETTPLPPYLSPKQGVMANKEQSTSNNKMLYIVGGVAALGLIGFLIFRKK